MQYTGWYDDANVGGIEGSISKMIAADPTFGEFNWHGSGMIVVNWQPKLKQYMKCNGTLAFLALKHCTVVNK